MKFKNITLQFIVFLLVVCGVVLCIRRFIDEQKLLLKIIERLSADSRVAEVMVTDARIDPKDRKTHTTIKFLEYDSGGKPLLPRYFTFSGNLIQFQSMVIRFDDFHVKQGHPFRGKSAYLFMKAFMLTDKGAQTFVINKVNEVPTGYAVEGGASSFERSLWKKFWEYAFSQKAAQRAGVKNAQIEAPGTKFIPGFIYTIKIEHDGGLRIDSQPLPQVMKGEKVNF